jgi:lysophospholipase L1-like esterase
VETRNRFGVLTEEGQADIETINSQTVLIGSSMAGSVGRALHWQLRGAFVWRKYSGAKIEEITKRVQEIELGEKVENLALMVGTNNLKTDGTEDIMEKYEELIRTAKEKGDRKIVVVGIISRSDLGDYYESKRLGINIRLKKKCEEMGVKYVEMGGQFKDRDSYLWDDGLHLNDAGAYKMGKAIFESIFPRFLSQRRPGVRGD